MPICVDFGQNLVCQDVKSAFFEVVFDFGGAGPLMFSQKFSKKGKHKNFQRKANTKIFKERQTQKFSKKGKHKNSLTHSPSAKQFQRKQTQKFSKKTKPNKEIC